MTTQKNENVKAMTTSEKLAIILRLLATRANGGAIPSVALFTANGLTKDDHLRLFGNKSDGTSRVFGLLDKLFIAICNDNKPTITKLFKAIELEFGVAISKADKDFLTNSVLALSIDKTDTNCKYLQTTTNFNTFKSNVMKLLCIAVLDGRRIGGIESDLFKINRKFDTKIEKCKKALENAEKSLTTLKSKPNFNTSEEEVLKATIASCKATLEQLPIDKANAIKMVNASYTEFVEKPKTEKAK